MNTVKIYLWTETRTVSGNAQTYRAYHMRPNPGPGSDDGGIEYELPDGFEVVQETAKCFTYVADSATGKECKVITDMHDGCAPMLLPPFDGRILVRAK